MSQEQIANAEALIIEYEKKITELNRDRNAMIRQLRGCGRWACEGCKWDDRCSIQRTMVIK